MRTSGAALPATEVALAGLLLTLTLTSGQTIVSGIQSQTVNLGETANLDCRVRDKGTYKLHWKQFFNNEFLPLSIEEEITAANPVEGLYPNNKTKYEVDKIVNNDLSVTYRLTINRLQATDAGLYECALVKLYGSERDTIRANGSLSIRGVLDGPRIVNKIGRVNGRVNNSVNLSCLVADKGDNPVKWKRMKDSMVLTSDWGVIASNPVEGGQLKYSISGQNTLTGAQFVLTITRLKLEESGDYQCYVETSHTPFPSQTGRLEIGVPPTISTTTPKNVTRQPGQTVSLECSAEGVPKPQIVWNRADDDLLPSGQLTFTGNNLVIPKINKDQRGLYRCLASNGVFPDAEYVFRVQVPFPPTSKPLDNAVKQAVGYLASMSCILKGYPDVVPTWYKMSGSNKIPVPTNDDNYQVTHSVGEGYILPINYNRFSLNIQKVKSTDFGQYRCEGVSNGQTAYSDITLTESASCVGSGCHNPGPGVTVTQPLGHTICTGSKCTGVSARLVRETLLLVLPLLLPLL